MREITINDILKMLLAHIKLIIILSVVVALGAYIYADNFVPKKYSASTMIYIKNVDDNQDYNSVGDSDEQSKLSVNDISASTKLASNCTVIFQNDLEMINANPHRYSVSISSVSESNVLLITVTGSDAEECAKTANNLRSSSKNVFSEYYSGGEVKTIGPEASAPSAPSSPDVTRYALFGFLAGLIISVLLAIIIEIIDTTIKPDDDLYKIYEVPVFAEIVDFELESGVKKR